MPLRTFLSFFVRALFWSVVFALLCHGVEGLVQAGWGVPRRADAWKHGAVVYLHTGMWVGLVWFLLLAAAESTLPKNWPRPRHALLPGLFFGYLFAVGGYWLNVSPSMPSFTTMTGKAWMMGIALASLALFALGWRWAGRRRHDDSRPPSWQVAFVVLCLVGVALTWPRERASSGEVLSENAAPGPPVVVILIDTLRRDHLSCYGYDRRTSPHVDALAAEGVLFENSTTSGNFTIPSVASLFTGRYPSGHGVVHAADDLPADVTTMAERFAKAGYRTGGFVANATVRAEMGFARGFETFHPAPPPSWVRDRRTAVELIAARLSGGGDVSETAHMVPRALEWLERDDDRPPFLYLHLIDPHSGYVPPREYFEPFLPPGVEDGPAHPPRIFEHDHDGVWSAWEDLPDPPLLTSDEVAGMVARYDGEIRFVDEWVGRVFARLRELGLYDEAIVVFLSDHGEEFGEHQGWFHGRTVYGEMIDMPLIVKLPGGEGAGTRTRLGVHMVDLLGTLGGLAGLEARGSEQGRDRSEELRARLREGDPAFEEDESFAFNERPPYLYSLRLGDWKIIQRSVEGQPRWSLYDLANDPAETVDRAAEAPNELVRLQSSLRAFQELVSGAETSDADPAELDPETLRVLRSLGYVE